MSGILIHGQEWNPRYVAYAAEHGRGADPAAQLADDKANYPGGRMAGFMNWISARWAEWRAANGVGRDDVLSAADHEAFTAWLFARLMPPGDEPLARFHSRDCAVHGGGFCKPDCCGWRQVGCGDARVALDARCTVLLDEFQALSPRMKTLDRCIICGVALDETCIATVHEAYINGFLRVQRLSPR